MSSAAVPNTPYRARDDARPPRPVRVWIPILLVWLVVIPLGLILTPLVMIIAFFWGLNPFVTITRLTAVLFALWGLEVDVTSHDAHVRIRFL